MIVDKNILKRLSARFGVQPISTLHPEIQNLLLQGSEQFMKAPAGFEPAITGGGYQWDDSINGYRLGNNQKIFLLPTGVALWTFKNVLARGIPPQSIQKWVSADDEYPMGKANAFFIIYGKMTGQDLGEGETAGDDVQDGETEPDEGGGIATADDEDQPPYSKADIQNMLKGEFPPDVNQGPSMSSSIPGGEPGTGKMPEEPLGLGPPPPERLAKGGPPKNKGSEADLIIKTIFKKAKQDPNAKPNKQHPIYLDSDEILDIYQRAKTLPPEDKEKLMAFLKSGIIKPLQEGSISKATLQSLMEHIVAGIVKEVDKAKKKSQAKKSIKNPASNPASNIDNDPDRDVDPDFYDPPHSQMDWEPGLEKDNEMGSQKILDRWVVQLATKLWGKHGSKLGNNHWSIDKRQPHESGGMVYMLKQRHSGEKTRFFAQLKGKWYYFNPDADVEDRRWKPVEENPPGEEPSIEQEQSGTGAAGPVTGPNAFKKDQPLDEMTTSSGGGGTSTGTTGYNIPGAFARKGGSKAGVEGSAKLGYTLTPQGKQDMDVKGDNLY